MNLTNKTKIDMDAADGRTGTQGGRGYPPPVGTLPGGDSAYFVPATPRPQDNF